MMKMIWILVASQAEAQIYSTERIPENLVLVDTLTHEQGAAHERDLISDAPGRVHDRMGPARHSMEPDTGIKEAERRRFVKQIVDRLKTAHTKGDFDQLVIVAEPAFMGVIRKTLDGELAKAVIKEISKGLVGQRVDRIQAQLMRSFELQ